MVVIADECRLKDTTSAIDIHKVRQRLIEMNSSPTVSRPYEPDRLLVDSLYGEGGGGYNGYQSSSYQRYFVHMDDSLFISVRVTVVFCKNKGYGIWMRRNTDGPGISTFLGSVIVLFRTDTALQRNNSWKIGMII